MRSSRRSFYKRLLKRYKDVLKENKKLKADLEEERQLRDNYWMHIVWLRTPADMKPKVQPCPICGSEGAGIDGSAGSRVFFVWCDKCGAMGPDQDSEYKAILAWNDAKAEDLTVFDDDDEDQYLAKMDNGELAQSLHGIDSWHVEMCRELCNRAGLLEEFEAAEDDEFEGVIFRAAEILDVEII